MQKGMVSQCITFQIIRERIRNITPPLVGSSVSSNRRDAAIDEKLMARDEAAFA
jgi:hypothetical protein